MDRITAVRMDHLGYKTALSLASGILGVSFAIVGHHFGYVDSRWFYFSLGAFFLFITAITENLALLAMLQLILLAGAGAMLAHFNLIFRTALPILLSIQAMLFFGLSGKLHDKVTILGCFGTLCLALGFCTHNPYIAFVGAASVTCYSFSLYRSGHKSAIYWIALNSYFTVASLIKLLHLLNS